MSFSQYPRSGRSPPDLSREMGPQIGPESPDASRDDTRTARAVATHAIINTEPTGEEIDTDTRIEELKAELATEKATTARLGEENAGLKEENAGLKDENAGLKEERAVEKAGFEKKEARLKSFVEQLAIDSRFGILTFNSQQTLFQHMLDTGILHEMHKQDYTCILTVVDIDKMKEHNNLGDHHGGDIALEAAIRRLQPLFRRDSDILAAVPHSDDGFLAHVHDADQAAQEGTDFKSFGRFATGDELVMLAFQPPTMSGGRRPLVDLEQRRLSFIAAMEGATARYPLTPEDDRAVDVIRNTEQAFGVTFRQDDFSVVEDKATIDVPVSATFAIISAPVPMTTEAFKSLFAQADGQLMAVKRERDTVKTQGKVLNLHAA